MPHEVCTTKYLNDDQIILPQLDREESEPLLSVQEAADYVLINNHIQEIQIVNFEEIDLSPWQRLRINLERFIINLERQMEQFRNLFFQQLGQREFYIPQLLKKSKIDQTRNPNQNPLLALKLINLTEICQVILIKIVLSRWHTEKLKKTKKQMLIEQLYFYEKNK